MEEDEDILRVWCLQQPITSTQKGIVPHYDSFEEYGSDSSFFRDESWDYVTGQANGNDFQSPNIDDTPIEDIEAMPNKEAKETEERQLNHMIEQEMAQKKMKEFAGKINELIERKKKEIHDEIKIIKKNLFDKP